MRLSSKDWIAWLGATIVAAMTMTATAIAWGYTTFVSKDTFGLIVERLDRIETKVDSILEK